MDSCNNNTRNTLPHPNDTVVLDGADMTPSVAITQHTQEDDNSKSSNGNLCSSNITTITNSSTQHSEIPTIDNTGEYHFNMTVKAGN